MYGKYLKKARINNIYNVAYDHFYYDIYYREVSKDKLTFLKSVGLNPEEAKRFIECFLNEYIENFIQSY